MGHTGRVSFCVNGDGLALDDKFSVLDLYGTLESTVGRVILEHVGLNKGLATSACQRGPADHVFEIDEGTVQSHLLSIRSGLRQKQTYSLTATTSILSSKRAFRKTIRPIRPDRELGEYRDASRAHAGNRTESG